MSETGRMEKPDSLRILSADLSQQCPGFAILLYEKGKVVLERVGHLDNHHSKKCHSAILMEIYKITAKLAVGIDVFVREKGFYRFHNETQALFKVVGVTDLAVWMTCRRVFYEIAPSTVKKALTGTGRAVKSEVAAALEQYVGRHEYATDDESDAVAVGITWLISQKLI